MAHDLRIAGEARRRQLVALAAIGVACLAPFAGKPVHLDDPLFVRCAQQALAHPADPYGFVVNWFGVTLPMADVMRNPPLSCYFLAIVGGLLGWSEVALHGAFFAAAVAALLGTYVLAERLRARPMLAALAMVSMPGFLVSSTTLMCDVLMLAFLVWAAVTFMAGVESRRWGMLACSSLLALAAGLTKYNGFIILPLLFVWAVARERRLGIWLLALVTPAALFVLYLAAMDGLYGEAFRKGLWIAAGSSVARPDIGQRVVVALEVSGGSFLTVLFYAPLLLRDRRVLAAAGVAGTLALALLGIAGLPGSPLLDPPPALDGASTLLQAALLLTSGALLIALAIRSLLAERDAGAVLLAAWVAATLAFATFASWSVSVRYLLPMAPAVAILLARACTGPGEPATAHGRRLYLPLVPALACALLIAVADARLAASARDVAVVINERYARADRTIWFQGHWGFQHYMESLGATALDMRSSRVAEGDIVVVPENNANTFPINQSLLEQLETIEVRPVTALATMSRPIGAGFYASVWGPLPFVLGPVPPERYVIHRVAPGRSEP
jgi:4-amino-4-deoxy-L-arabinose transferase-like glycosyltransferase